MTTIQGPAEITIPGTDIVTVVFHWSKDHGHCEECGLPAAFYYLDAFGPGKHMPVCCVCAANFAADGEMIARIDEERSLLDIEIEENEARDA